MSMETALSVGIGLIKHRQEIGAAISSLGKLSGESFGKIAQELHLPQGLSQKIDQALSKGRIPQNTSRTEVLAGLKTFDANLDGKITREELTQELNRLKSSGQIDTDYGARLYSMGDLLLKNYDKVAQLDGKASSVSTEDVLKLVAQDGKADTLSSADWQGLNA
jgi:hypothetical protein